MPPFYGRLTDDEIRGLVKHLQATPKLSNPAWTIDDIKASIKVYVKDESTLPAKRHIKSTASIILSASPQGANMVAVQVQKPCSSIVLHINKSVKLLQAPPRTLSTITPPTRAGLCKK